MNHLGSLRQGLPHGGQVHATQSHRILATVKGLGSPFGGDLTASHDDIVIHSLHQDGPPGGFAKREVC